MSNPGTTPEENVKYYPDGYVIEDLDQEVPYGAFFTPEQGTVEFLDGEDHMLVNLRTGLAVNLGLAAGLPRSSFAITEEGTLPISARPTFGDLAPLGSTYQQLREIVETI